MFHKLQNSASNYYSFLFDFSRRFEDDSIFVWLKSGQRFCKEFIYVQSGLTINTIY